jgi:2-amino-4-hydroxy-6-hydroxymethyldihydropteridine diphosphokinase
LGSNQPLPHIGRPAQIIAQAIEALEMADIDVFAQSPAISSRPLGPARRVYANAAAIVSTSLLPPELLVRLQEIEAHFGRQRRGQQWGARTLDLDILIWSGGIWSDNMLSVPHVALRERSFVLTPASMIAPDWRDPVTGLSIRQLQSRQAQPKRLDPRGQRH